MFIKAQSFSLTEVLTHESNYNLDLNNDGGVGEVIITNVTQNNDFGLYITASGAFVVDQANLTLGDSTVDPTLLITQISSRGKTTVNLYKFENYLPTGIVSLNNGEINVYYKDSKENWYKNNFSDGVFIKNH